MEKMSRRPSGYRIAPEVVPTYRLTMRLATRYAERTAPELFRWLGWSTALAAVQVVAIRTESGWLKWAPFVLAFFVSARIQWFIGIKHPEVELDDGSLVINFQRWRFLIAPVGWLLTWVFAIGAANLIAQSDLLPAVQEQARRAEIPETTIPDVTPGAMPKSIRDAEAPAKPEVAPPAKPEASRAGK